MSMRYSYRQESISHNFKIRSKSYGERALNNQMAFNRKTKFVLSPYIQLYPT